MAAYFLLFCAFGFPCITLFSVTIWFGTALSEAKTKRQSDPSAKRTEAILSGAYLAVSITLSLLSSLALPTAELPQICRTVGVTALTVGVCLAPVSTGVWFVRAVIQMKKADAMSAEYMQQNVKAWVFGAATLLLSLAVAAAWVLLFQELPAE